MLEGICPKCGIRQIGWALHFQRYQTCFKCGSGLDIYESGKLVAKGYSPFTAEKYLVDLSHAITPEGKSTDAKVES